MEYAAFGDNWGKMGIPQFSPIFGEKNRATPMGKIGESSSWGQSNILGNNGDKSPIKPQISKWGQGQQFWRIWTPYSGCNGVS